MPEIGNYKSSEWTNILGEWGRYACEEIYNTYGHTVKPKFKTLRKFGRKTIPAKNVRQTVMAQASTAVVHETYTTANTIDSVVCSSAGNTQSLTLEGHTIDTSGDLTFATRNVTLNGTTPSTFEGLARLTRMYVRPGTFASPTTSLSTSAVVYGYDSAATTAVTAGVPQTATAVHAMMDQGLNQTEKCATSVSHKDYWVITGIEAGLPEAASPSGTAAIDIDVEVRDVKGGVFRPIGTQLSIGAGSRYATEEYKPFIVVPRNSDVRMVAEGSTTDVEVTGTIAGFLLGVSTEDF